MRSAVKRGEPKVRVKFMHSTGHEELDAENGIKPHFFEFDTEAEARAFIRGVEEAQATLDGWLEGSVSAEIDA